jgi:hypothetical protein
LLGQAAKPSGSGFGHVRNFTYLGGTCMEDLNLYLKDTLTERPQTRVPSADTVLRGYKGLVLQEDDAQGRGLI